MEWVKEALIILVIALLFATPFIGVIYYQSCREAKVYNQSHIGTDYSCSDFFWAGDQINSQRQTIKLED